MRMSAMLLLAAGFACASPGNTPEPSRTSPNASTATQDTARSHVHLRDVTWWSSAQYPEELRRVYRYKALIGGSRPGVVPQDDVLMGFLELAPGRPTPGTPIPRPRSTTSSAAPRDGP